MPAGPAEMLLNGAAWAGWWGFCSSSCSQIKPVLSSFASPPSQQAACPAVHLPSCWLIKAKFCFMSLSRQLSGARIPSRSSRWLFIQAARLPSLPTSYVLHVDALAVLPMQSQLRSPHLHVKGPSA